jgi:hypothetical protein
MLYRLILYILTVLAYGFAQYFAESAPANAKNLFQFWLILFGFVILESGYRVRNSPYALFPAGYLIAIMLQYLEVGSGLVYQSIGAWLHVGLGLWLVYLRFRPSSEKTGRSNVLLIAAAGCLVFGLNGVNYFLELRILDQLLQFRLSSYLLIASAGTFLLSDQPPRQLPGLIPIFRLVLIIHVFLVISRVVANYLT